MNANAIASLLTMPTGSHRMTVREFQREGRHIQVDLCQYPDDAPFWEVWELTGRLHPDGSLEIRAHCHTQHGEPFYESPTEEQAWNLVKETEAVLCK